VLPLKCHARKQFAPRYSPRFEIMLTLRLLPPAPPARPHLPVLRRWLLRLRARWLDWRGMAPLHAVSVGQGLAQSFPPRDAAAYHRQLLELNLLFERARAGQGPQGGKSGQTG
jgi:hypothetical protein